MHLKISSVKWQPLCYDPNVLTYRSDWVQLDEIMCHSSNVYKYADTSGWRSFATKLPTFSTRQFQISFQCHNSPVSAISSAMYMPSRIVRPPGTETTDMVPVSTITSSCNICNTFHDMKMIHAIKYMKPTTIWHSWQWNSWHASTGQRYHDEIYSQWWF